MSNLKKINSTAKISEEILVCPAMLALPFGDLEESIVYSKFCLSEHYNRIVEPAGEAFENYATRKLNPEPDKLFEDSNDDIIEEDKIEYEWEKEYRESKKNQTGFTKGKEDNYYSLLGLEEEFLNATPEDVKKAYKKYALVWHPDKVECNSEEEKEQANKNWLKFKTAYETLTDPDKKYKYDSTFKFDDEIPNKDVKIKSDKDFFKKFGPVFLKNSIWSIRKPVPKIGDMNTELRKVKQFYNFWTGFKSWRDFEVEGENNLEEAENRWEKRAMQKENKKLKAVKLKEEMARIRTLVDIAYSLDPRVIAEEKRIEAEKEKLRIERMELLAKQKAEKEENDRRLKEEFEEKKRKQAEDLLILKQDLSISLFKTINDILGIKLTNDEIFSIKLNSNIETMKIVLNEIENEITLENKIKAFKSQGSKYLGLKFVDDNKESSIWTRDEVGLLQKATKKYPVGTVSRYEKILEIVKTKSTDQIIQMSRYLQTNPSMKFTSDTVDLKVLMGLDKKKDLKEEKVTNKDNIEIKAQNEKETNSKDENCDWNETQQKALELALKKYPASMPANERWTAIAAEVPEKNKKQCVERFKYLAQVVKNNQK